MTKNDYVFEKAKNQIMGAVFILHALGYGVKVVSIPKNEDEYKELPIIIIQFMKRIFLTSIPKEFELCHVIEENCSYLLSKMPQTEKSGQIEENLLIASNYLLVWANTQLNTLGEKIKLKPERKYLS